MNIEIGKTRYNFEAVRYIADYTLSEQENNNSKLSGELFIIQQFYTFLQSRIRKL